MAPFSTFVPNACARLPFPWLCVHEDIFLFFLSLWLLCGACMHKQTVSSSEQTDERATFAGARYLKWSSGIVWPPLRERERESRACVHATGRRSTPSKGWHNAIVCWRWYGLPGRFVWCMWPTRHNDNGKIAIITQRKTEKERHQPNR